MTEETPTRDLRCPECDAAEHTLIQLGRVGPRESFGVRCASCETAVAEVELSEIHTDADLPSEREMFDG
jgi:hypothetical protein